jgi:hypothetical protein
MSIFIASHKEYSFPNDPGYIPIHVGSSLSFQKMSFLPDNNGENISILNPCFCELTALYWLWKNNTDDLIGLVHYRRYFYDKDSNLTVNGKKIARSEYLYSKLKDYDILVPKKRNYYITSIKNHYKFSHDVKDLIALRVELAEQYPSYLTSFDNVMNGTELSLYNMFVGKRSVMEKYFTWLFDLLIALEGKIHYQEYDAYQKRLFGFMAERLFNVWLFHNKNEIKIGYLSVTNIEGENFIKKAFGLINRQFLTRKYN